MKKNQKGFKLSMEQANEIRRRYKPVIIDEGASKGRRILQRSNMNELCKEFGISKSYFYDIIHDVKRADTKTIIIKTVVNADTPRTKPKRGTSGTEKIEQCISRHPEIGERCTLDAHTHDIHKAVCGADLDSWHVVDWR